ncbi:MAG TPA: hypothetical protein DIT29_04165 [Pseudothermotoga sp.]|nr:hypothetical protein [Pseudothermotoga sp.]HCO97903.1 hypothetical protein [Pseudothermotoga sp.]
MRGDLLDGFGKYTYRNSLVHAINPVLKIVYLIVALALFFTSRSAFYCITLFSTLLILMLLSKVGLRIFLHDLLKFKWLLLIIFFVQTIPFASANLTSLLVRASRSVLLVSFSILATSLVFRTTSNVTLARAFEVILRGLGMKKVARKISLMIMLALVQIPILFEQMEKIRTAQTLRGQTWRTKNPQKVLKSLESIVVPMLFFSLKRAESLSVSLEMRKYGISSKPTLYKPLKLSWPDSLPLLMITLLFVSKFLRW